MISTSSGTKAGRKRNLTSILGCLTISEKQAQKLKVKSRSRWSPYLEKCCLLLSANESYQRAEEDLKVLTGIEVSHGTQHRMVHRQGFKLLTASTEVSEISMDGGKIIKVLIFTI